MSYLGNDPAEAYSPTVKDTFSGNDSTTDFTLSIPATTNSVEVFVENVQQEPTDAYTIAGTTLSFTAAPVTGTNNIYVIHRGPAVQQVVPPAGVAIDASSVTASGNLSVTGTTTLTDDLAVDTNTLVVDTTNNRVGIGTAGPSTALDVNGTVTADGLTVDGDGLLQASGTGNVELTLKNNNVSPGSGRILFADSVDSDAGVIQYEHGGGADAMVFKTATNEAMRIDSSGNVGIGTSSPSGSLTAETSDIQGVGRFKATNGSYTSYMTFLSATRSASSAFHYLGCDSNAGADNEFRLRGDGNAFADGTWSGGGADYAEYFEWLDGNTSNEDRRGYTVVLDGNKVRKATDADDSSQIIGAVSATPCVVGDHADNKWTGKYLKDDFGNYIFESHNVVEWTEQELVEEAQEAVFDEEGNVIQESKEAVYNETKHSYEDWNIPEGIVVPDDATVLTHDDKGNRLEHRKLNPDFDPDAEYITREKRPEWSPIGMMGKLRIRKGQPVGDRWIKMRDISDSVEEWLVR